MLLKSKSAIRQSVAVISCMACGAASAAELSVFVLDEDGRPVENVVVLAEALDPAGAEVSSRPARAVMEQVDVRFVPHVLVVPTGTEVDFPNNDTVSHHVYSFSKPKTFELPLYKDEVYPPVVFDEPGLVVLGCNIHDNMLGYILVVDTPFYSVTGSKGAASLDGLPAGRYDVRVWTPRARSRDLPETVSVQVDSDATARIDVRFADRLRPPHSHAEGALIWSHY